MGQLFSVSRSHCVRSIPCRRVAVSQDQYLYSKYRIYTGMILKLVFIVCVHFRSNCTLSIATTLEWFWNLFSLCLYIFLSSQITRSQMNNQRRLFFLTWHFIFFIWLFISFSLSMLLSVYSPGISVGFMATCIFFSCKSSSSGCLLRSILLSVHSSRISVGFMLTSAFFSCKSSSSGCLLRSLLLSVYSSGISVGFMVTSAFFSCKSSSSGCLLRSLLLSVHSSGISAHLVDVFMSHLLASSSGCSFSSNLLWFPIGFWFTWVFFSC